MIIFEKAYKSDFPPTGKGNKIYKIHPLRKCVPRLSIGIPQLFSIPSFRVKMVADLRGARAQYVSSSGKGAFCTKTKGPKGPSCTRTKWSGLFCSRTRGPGSPFDGAHLYRDTGPKVSTDWCSGSNIGRRIHNSSVSIHR